MSHSTFWPDDTTVPPSVAHKITADMNTFGSSSYPDGLVPWHAGHAPDLALGHSVYTQGRIRSCGYCGSMHPSDLVAAIRAGAHVYWADFKYGWPHKVYVEGVPNPYVGMPCSTTSTGYGSKPGVGKPTEPGDWVQLRNASSLAYKDEFASYAWHKRDVERPTTHGKFYTIHLLDASPDERDVIERAMGLNFDFRDDGRVGWKKYEPPSKEGSAS